MKINLVELKRQDEKIKDEIGRAIARIIENTDFILGKDVQSFEEEFAAFCGTKHAIGVDSGTSALELSLLASGIGKGDGVIVPTFTFFATASAVCYTGAVPVFVDVCEKTGNLNVDKVEDCAKRSGIKAIIPVHLFGQPCNMEAILEIAKKYNLKVIEDAAQAHGAEYKFKVQGSKFKVQSSEFRVQKVGGIGDMGCFSFYPAKNLGCYGDGGAVITNSDEFAKKVKLLRDCGRTDKYTHEVLGYNKRLDNLQAAILRIKLRLLNEWNEERRKIARHYAEKLRNIAEVNVLEVEEYALPVYHMFVIRSKKRDELREYLAAKGIGTGVHYPIPLHIQAAFSFLGYKRGDFPVSEKLAEEVLSLPLFPGLKGEEIDYIVSEIKNFYD